MDSYDSMHMCSLSIMRFVIYSTVENKMLPLSMCTKQCLVSLILLRKKFTKSGKVICNQCYIIAEFTYVCHHNRFLDHPNVCKFIGASVETPKIVILTEYCPKGSLNDVLQNSEIHLNWGFRFSFADDIARGMAYLHSKGIFHGRLKSTNCLINNRWVLKISGMNHAIVVLVTILN